MANKIDANGGIEPEVKIGDQLALDIQWASDGWLYKHLFKPELAHALGSINLYWNFCEQNLVHIATTYSGEPHGGAAERFFGLPAEQLITRIRNLVASAEGDDNVRADMLHALECADICRMNRNEVMHSWINYFGDRIFKQNRKTATTLAYHFTIDDMRRVADECSYVGAYVYYAGVKLGLRGRPNVTIGVPALPKTPERLTPIDNIPP